MYNPYQRAFYDRLTDESCIFGRLGTLVEKPGVWKSILTHGPFHLLCFLFTILFFTFGIGYQTITFFLLPAIILIVLYSRMVPSIWFIPVLLWPAMTVGTFFAYAGALSTTESPWQSPDTILMLPVSAFFAFLIALTLCLDRSIAIYAYFILPFVEIFFGFPMVWAGVWSLMNRVSPFGRVGNWGYAVALMGIDNFTMGVTWSVGAVAGGAYAFAVIVSAFCYLSRRYVEVYHSDRIERLSGQARPAPFLVAPKKHVRSFFTHPVMFIFYFAMIFYGFGSIYQPFGPAPQAFYQRPISKFMPPNVQVSCLVNASIETTTNHLLTTGFGSQVLLWSEGSVTVDNDTVLIESGKVVSRRFNVYLGLAYNLRIPKKGKYEYQSMFTLIAPPGPGNSTSASVAIRYQKRNPLALIESITEPSPGKPNFPFVETPFGKMGVLFESDAVYGALISAYQNGVVLMLQPSKTFGPNGVLDAQLSRLVALEYGLSQFRCVEGGISTVNDPFYRTLIQQPTLQSKDSFAFKVPIYSQQWTMYTFLPDYLGIMTMAFFLLWIVLLVGFWLMRIRRRHQPKKWPFEPVPFELPFTD